MFDKNVNCLTCDKQIPKSKAQKFKGVYFCSPTCQEQYEKQLHEIGQNMHLNDCC